MSQFIIMILPLMVQIISNFLPDVGPGILVLNFSGISPFAVYAEIQLSGFFVSQISFLVRFTFCFDGGENKYHIISS